MRIGWIPFAVFLIYAAAFSVQAEPSPITSYKSREIVNDATEASTAMSPDGRWLAYWETISTDDEELRILDLVRGTVRDTALHPFDLNASDIAWRPDSQAVAVDTTEGTTLVDPADLSVRWIVKFSEPLAATSGMDLGCSAWSPRTGLFASFGSYGSWSVWNGSATRTMPDWMKTTGAPNYASEHIWQCAWSPDENHILLRFYGLSGGRSYSSSLHAFVFTTKTGHMTPWTREAGPTTWIDNKRLVYRHDYGYAGAAPLIVANATTGREQRWKKDIVAYAVSADRSIIYAANDRGSVYVSPTVHRQWKRIYRLGTQFSMQRSSDWTLAAIPGGFVARIGRYVKGRTYYSLIAWRDGKVVSKVTTGDDVKLIGWSPARKAFIIVIVHGQRAAVRAVFPEAH